MATPDVSSRELSARTPGSTETGEMDQGQGGDSDGFNAKAWLAQTTGEIRESFARNRRVISFDEYLALFALESARQLRSAGQYLRDVFEHFGTETVRTPRGLMTRSARTRRA